MESVISARTLFEQSQQPESGSQDEQNQGSVKHERNLNLAYQHALLIQHRKDVEARILSSIETLSEIPESVTLSAYEHITFVNDVSIFQPSDFDDLVSERVSQTRCGYVLCHQKPRSSTSRTWRLPNGAADFCSNTCHGKAAYVRAQLSAIPAWERSPSELVQVVVQERPADAAPAQTKSHQNADLAFERGEKVTSRKPEQVMTKEIIEKDTDLSLPMPPKNSSTNAIEGYVPKHEQEDEATPSVDLGIEQITASSNEGNTRIQATYDEEQQWKDMFSYLQR